MKYKSLKYTKEFEFHIGKEWVGTDVEIEEGDDLDEVFRQVKAKVHQLVTGSNPESQPTQQVPPREIKVDKVPEEERLAAMLRDILSCTELAKPNGLLSFEAFVKLANKPDITAAYDLKLKELTEGK